MICNLYDRSFYEISKNYSIVLTENHIDYVASGYGNFRNVHSPANKQIIADLPMTFLPLIPILFTPLYRCPVQNINVCVICVGTYGQSLSLRLQNSGNFSHVFYEYM
jgi:hypothetical protein